MSAVTPAPAPTLRVRAARLLAAPTSVGVLAATMLTALFPSPPADVARAATRVPPDA